MWDGAQMVILGEFLRPIFSASRVQNVSVWQTSDLRRLRLGKEKKEQRRTKYRAKI